MDSVFVAYVNDDQKCVRSKCLNSVMILNFFLVKSECGQTTNQITSYFQNPGWPEASSDRIICTLTVDLQNDAVQVLLDFVTFEVSGSD